MLGTGRLVEVGLVPEGDTPNSSLPSVDTLAAGLMESIVVVSSSSTTVESLVAAGCPEGAALDSPKGTAWSPNGLNGACVKDVNVGVVSSSVSCSMLDAACSLSLQIFVSLSGGQVVRDDIASTGVNCGAMCGELLLGVGMETIKASNTSESRGKGGAGIGNGIGRRSERTAANKFNKRKRRRRILKLVQSREGLR